MSNSSVLRQALFGLPRPKIEKIPSPKCQTILYKSALEHFCDIEHFASFVLVSETFRNSSFGANFVMNFEINCDTIKLFIIISNIITPKSCQSLQFIPLLKINANKCESSALNFAAQLVNTKYFHLQLQELTLDHVDEKFISCFFGAPEKKWPQLKTLSLTNGDVNDADAELVSKKLPSLTSLSLYSSIEITDVGLEKIAANLRSLTFLDLSGNEQFTDIGMKEVAKLPLLTSLDLSWLCRITDVGLEHISSITSLTSINRYCCDKITSFGKEKFKAALPNCRFA